MRFILLLLLCLCAFGQNLVTLRGVISDESGAVVPGARVSLGNISATTGPDGSYTISGLAPGAYTVQVSAPGLSLSQAGKITLKSGVQTLNLQLKVAALSEQVTVAESGGSTVTPEPANNASALVLRGADLEALADDPTDLEEDLRALAGPAAGPNGGAIFIDGFSGGQLPSKDSIREIRINSNPFSPEYDKLGFGRIEIFTKPGSDKYRGAAFYNFSDDVWNSRNAYSANKAPFLLREYGGNFGGPIGKRASFFADVRRDATDNGSIINAVTLDPSGVARPFDGVYNVEQRSLRGNARIDYQLNPNNTLIARYSALDMNIPGAGVGSFNLASRGYLADTLTHTVQLSETAVLGAGAVNEVRFQYYRYGINEAPLNSGPAVQVLGSFNGGAATVGNSSDAQNSYEFQEIVTMVHGTHNLRFGARLRELQDDNVSAQNYNGTFTFSGGGISSIEQYRRTLAYAQQGYTPAQIRALGGGASQFTIAAGNPSLSASQFDAGVFFGDDWRVRPNLTMSVGLRYETQTNIHDWHDIAPRIGFAWAPGQTRKGGTPKTVLRAGFGMFYDRFALGDTLNALRNNGVVQQVYTVTNPDFFPNVPPAGAIGGLASVQSVRLIASDLRAPYIMQSAFTVERALPLKTTVAVTYANSHGLHLLRSRDINAPLLGTHDPAKPNSGVYPFGVSGPRWLSESAGLYNQNQMIVNVNTRMNSNVSFTAGYMLNEAKSNTDGLGTSPANPYNYAGEYGPSSTDVRQRFTLSGSFNTRWNVRFSPFLIAESGPPFDITTGEDLYGTTVFNVRPALARDPNKPGVISTPYGLLDPHPSANDAVLVRNFGRGPGSVMLNGRISKTFGFGHGPEKASAAPTPGGPQQGPGSPEGRRAPVGIFSTGGGGGTGGMFGTPVNRPYNLIISMTARNLLNHNNPGPIIGNITSPLFGMANQPAGSRDLGGGGFSESANNRRLELQIRFTF